MNSYKCLMMILIISIYVYQNTLLSKMLDSMSVQYCSDDQVSNVNNYVNTIRMLNSILIGILLASFFVNDIFDNAGILGFFIFLVIIVEITKIWWLSSIIDSVKSTCTEEDGCKCSFLNVEQTYYWSMILSYIVYTFFAYNIFSKVNNIKEWFSKKKTDVVVNMLATPVKSNTLEGIKEGVYSLSD